MVTSIPQQAARLNQPFTMIDLAQIDELVLSVYLCQGTMPFHRHLDQDELFLVQTGAISLESDWGTAQLRAGELAVVPKGLSHRSSSAVRSHVILLQPRAMVNRRNGHRRLFSLAGEAHLEKVSVFDVGRRLQARFAPIVLAHVDVYALTLAFCRDVGPWWQAQRQDSLVLCCAGRVDVETADGSHTPLGDWEFVVVPKGLAYRLSTSGNAWVIGLRRHRQSAGAGTG